MSDDGRILDWGKELGELNANEGFRKNATSKRSASLSSDMTNGQGETSPDLRGSNSSPTYSNNNNVLVNAPKYGTLVPNRIFVGGLSLSTTDEDLAALFSEHGVVQSAKVIVDRAGVSKGYGFVTFLHEDDAKKLILNSDFVILNNRRLNIAPAIKKQPFTNCSYENGPSQQLPYSHPQMTQGMCFNQNSVHMPIQYPYPMPQLQPPMPAEMNMLVYQPSYGVTGIAPSISAPSSAACYQMMPNHSMFVPNNPGQMQLAAYHQIQPPSLWADPGLAAQYQVAQGMPYLMQMY